MIDKVFQFIKSQNSSFFAPLHYITQNEIIKLVYLNWVVSHSEHKKLSQ